MWALMCKANAIGSSGLIGVHDWGLGFGVWDLGLGVWGLGLGFYIAKAMQTATEVIANEEGHVGATMKMFETKVKC